MLIMTSFSFVCFKMTVILSKDGRSKICTSTNDPPELKSFLK